MAGNFKYWLYDKSAVTPWYFWTPKTASSDDRLRELGILEDTPVQATGLSASINEANKPSLIEKATDTFTGIRKAVIEDPAKDIFEGGKTLVDDIKLLSEGRIDETKGLLWDFLKAWEGRVEKINEFNASVDATGGNMFDKAIWTGFNIIWAGVDFTWDVLVSSLKTLAPEGLERATEEWLQNFLQSDFGKWTVDFIKTGGEKYEAFKQTSPEANRLWLTIESLLPLAEVATGWATGKVIKEVGWEILETWVKKSGEILTSWKEIAWESIDSLKEWASNIKDKVSDIELPSFKKEVDEIPSEMRTVKGNINWVEVEVPEVIRPLTEKAADKLSPTITNKTLAWSAVRPRTIGKNRKQKLESISKVEERTKNFYNNIRTGILDWDISTLENSAQSIVLNLDTVWARIGEAVQKVDWNIQFDNELTDNIINALNTKGSEVSPASPILNKFFETLGDWNLSIKEAYDLKKAYSNEVSKLVKWWDAWTAQYKALADWVNFLNTKIDEIIETKLWGQFADDKKLYRDLLFLADDMVASSLVDGRRTANTLAERIGMLESITSPVASIKWKLISASERVNTRGWAWEELIKRYDEEAVKNLTIK